MYKLRNTLDHIKCLLKEELPNQWVCCWAMSAGQGSRVWSAGLFSLHLQIRRNTSYKLKLSKSERGLLFSELCLYPFWSFDKVSLYYPTSVISSLRIISLVRVMNLVTEYRYFLCKGGPCFMPNSFTTSILMASSVPGEWDYSRLCPLVGGSVASSSLCCGGREHQIGVVLDPATFN